MATTSPGPDLRSVLTQEELRSVERQLAAAVRRSAPRWLAEQAEDLVQTALLKVVEMVARGEGNELPGSSYLWRVGYTAVVDEIRRRRRRREVAMDDGEGPVNAVSDQPGPEHTSHARRIGEGIRACLQQLAAARRQALTLHLLGHSVPEVAALLGWPGKRADNAVYRGLADLRVCLSGKGIEP